MKKKEKLEFVEQYEKRAEELFGKISFQTIKFSMLENLREIPNSPDFMTIEKSVISYLSWQNKPLPKDKIIKSKYKFNHEDDLRWNECFTACEKYRKSREESRKKYEEITISEQYKDSLDDPMVEALLQMETLRNGK